MRLSVNWERERGYSDAAPLLYFASGPVCYSAVVVLGGIPLLWETLRQFQHKEFGVDIIALPAIAESILLGEYLAGALVVLMMSGGEALAERSRPARMSGVGRK